MPIEGTTEFVTESEERITRKMPVFYNPAMRLNRDLSLMVLATMDHPKIGLPMEASGVRAARIEHELVEPGLLRPREILVNDISPRAIELAKRNVKEATFSTEDASVFLRKHKPFDYIDIDPFGTPNPFLDAACQAIRKHGILAVTATDTAALTGTYPRVTRRKYWAEPSRTWAMHDLALRILIRKVQLVAAQYEKALTPLLSVSREHYYRIFFRSHQGVNPCKEIVRQHGFVHVDTKEHAIARTEKEEIGPLWLGPLHDERFAEELLGLDLGNQFDEAKRLLAIIRDECRAEMIGFYDMHELARVTGKEPPRRDGFLQDVEGHRTHITPTGFKSDLPPEKILKTFARRTGRDGRRKSPP